jgi:hypothetical protein
VEGPGPCVHCLVSSQLAVAAQCLPAHATYECGPVSTALLLLKDWLLPTGLPTHLALESHGLVHFASKSSSGKPPITFSLEDPFLEGSSSPGSCL